MALRFGERRVSTLREFRVIRRCSSDDCFFGSTDELTISGMIDVQRLGGFTRPLAEHSRLPESPAVDTADFAGRPRISTLPEEITVYPAECCYSSADSDRRSAKYVMDVDSHSVDLISEAFSGVLQADRSF